MRLSCFLLVCAAAHAGAEVHVPRLWDERALAEATLPPALPEGQIVYVSAEYFYRTPGLEIYRAYPVYHPAREPKGYLDRLKRLPPQRVFDPSKLKTESDWINAGEIAFNAPTDFGPIDHVRDPDWWEQMRPPLTKDGAIAGLYYVVREKGKVELGSFSCATCHSRVLPDGSVAAGAQGNFPVEPWYAYEIRKSSARPDRRLEYGLHFSAAEKKRLTAGLYDRPVEEIAGVHEAMIPGIAMRMGFSYLDPPKIADLIGLKDRKYLDMTARLQHRSIAEVMRYGALNAGMMNYFFSGSGPVPEKDLPDPTDATRYTDEQAYAYSLYVYSLKPPPNPNRPSALTERGKAVFAKEGCARCHTPPLYTNNAITPAEGFRVPEDHAARYNILPVSVGTDSRSAMKSLRGRGYYKVPSLKGVWYRGPFEHNGSVATLEDWFDSARLRDSYIPTGFKGYGVKTRAVKGHAFGLNLNADDKAALIAFLKTL